MNKENHISTLALAHAAAAENRKKRDYEEPEMIYEQMNFIHV